jgi:hypothetical protein
VGGGWVEIEAALAMFVAGDNMLARWEGSMAVVADHVEGVTTAFGRVRRGVCNAIPQDVRQECARHVAFARCFRPCVPFVRSRSWAVDAGCSGSRAPCGGSKE